MYGLPSCPDAASCPGELQGVPAKRRGGCLRGHQMQRVGALRQMALDGTPRPAAAHQCQAFEHLQTAV